MLTRIVQLTFQEDKVELFLANFENNKTAIRGFEGCQHLKLLRDKHNPNRFFTYSKWESEAHLNAYRNSDLFNGVWAKTKVLFSEKPMAWSVDVVEELS
ncbi:MAG: antibiotic biosynthesis monooxygenase [Flavobacteriales bacterium]|nr:antibiotic biosynthesis monooxygenase [Flavobacteriales bacterium]